MFAGHFCPPLDPIRIRIRTRIHSTAAKWSRIVKWNISTRNESWKSHPELKNNEFYMNKQNELSFSCLFPYCTKKGIYRWNLSNVNLFVKKWKRWTSIKKLISLRRNLKTSRASSNSKFTINLTLFKSLFNLGSRESETHYLYSHLLQCGSMRIRKPTIEVM